MDFADIKNTPEKELHTLLAEKREELRHLRFQSSEKQLKNIHGLRALKRLIARILTVLNAKPKKNA